MLETQQGYVKKQVNNHICTIEFFHPQSNSLPTVILEKLTRVILDAGIDDKTKVIILRSAGEKIFCSGASFDELASIKTQEQGMQFFSGFANVINAIRVCGKLVIARVPGKCIGGGVGLAAAADYAIATDSAAIKLSELAVGIGPFVIGPACERKLGVSAFSSLSIDTFNWRTAEWAKQNGLFAELHATTELMDESITKLAENLACSSIEATSALKQIFWKGTENWDILLKERAVISGKLILSDFSKSFILQFKEKTNKK